MEQHTGALYIKRAGKYLAYTHTGADVQRKQKVNETLKDELRRTTDIMVKQDETNAIKEVQINTLECIVREQQQTIKGLDRRTREYQESLHEKDSLIATLTANQLTLQRKVDELDRRLAGEMDIRNHEQTK